MVPSRPARDGLEGRRLLPQNAQKTEPIGTFANVAEPAARIDRGRPKVTDGV
jgi:hypothetical protein